MKKFTILVFCFLMIVSCCLTGCSTFSIDYVKFYNETVATVNNEKIIRYDLINAYNNYGYQYYVTQQGQSEKEAMNTTLDTIVNRKLLADYAKNYKKDNESIYALTEYDINNVYQSVLDNLQESFDSFLTTARKMYDFEQPKEAEEAEEETAYLQSGYKYEKRAELVLGDIIKYKDQDDEKIEVYALGEKNKDFVTNYSSKTKNDIITRLYATFMEKAYENRYAEESYNLISSKAISLFAKSLISYEYYLRDENGKAYNTYTPDLIKRYIERVYDSELESAYIANVEEYYLKEQSELQNLSVNKLLTKYIDLAETDYAKYVNSTTDYYNYLKTIGTSAEMIYFTPANADAEFGYFLHVLLPLDSTVVESINNKKALFEAGFYDDGALEYEINLILSGQTHQARNASTGLLEENKIGVLDILNEYDNSVSNIDDFMKFMFKYTSDTATLTADMPYVIGYDDLGDEDSTNDVNYSGMVTEFTNEAVRLLREDETITTADNYVITEYGIHLLCYVGEVKAGYKYADRNAMTISLDRSKANNLYYAETNEFTGKTYFDLLFDLVYPASEGEVYASDNGYTEMESRIIEGIRTPENVTVYDTKVDGTLEILK